jgi:hypothetical protein
MKYKLASLAVALLLVSPAMGEFTVGAQCCLDVVVHDV